MQRTGSGDEVEFWMEESNIGIACLQESRSKTTGREVRKYTLFFRRRAFTHSCPWMFAAGVAVVIRNDVIRHLSDVQAYCVAIGG
eukprot:2562120-Prorocentrum_lima.AAC.1